ncbi:MAG: glycosyltransferase [Opitutales bacterium]|nr:glycosyltransferase [Opitutales bacterium]
MKLNFFTPLPPLATDIAQCVSRVLPALAARFDVTLWTSQEKVDKGLRQSFRVRSFRPDNVDWRELNYADINLYNIGNDARFHAPILEFARRYPGVVLMHDVAVHELIYATLERKPLCLERYMELLERDGPQAVEAGRAFLAGKLALRDVSVRHPLTWWPLERAAGVVSHNAEALRRAVPRLDAPLLDTPLPWLPKAQMQKARARVLDAGRMEMLVCGHLNSPNRRLSQLLEALATFPLRDRLLLHVAGAVKDEKTLKQKIAALGLRSQVKLHGYLSEKALGRLMDSCHMALNLRWPSVGEASGAQLRFWNHSLPTVATKTAWYAQQPEDCLMLVDPEREAEDLHRYWNLALGDYAGVAQFGLRGRELLERRHSAESFASALEAFLPVVERYRESLAARPLAERVGRALGDLSVEDANLKASIASRFACRIAEMSGTLAEDGR